MTAEKETKIIGSSHYAISLDSKFSTIFYTAELVCNTATGTSYTLYVLNKDQRQELAVISYVCKFKLCIVPVNLMFIFLGKQFFRFERSTKIRSYITKI